MILPPQVTKLRDEVAKVHQVMANKDEESAESIQKAGAELQKASLKLFEMAYKKVCMVEWVLFSLDPLPCTIVSVPNIVHIQLYRCDAI